MFYFAVFICFVQILLRLILHALHEVFCMKYVCMRHKVFAWGCQVYSVTLPLYQVLQSRKCLISRLIVFGICECVLYMGITWSVLIPRIGALRKVKLWQIWTAPVANFNRLDLRLILVWFYKDGAFICINAGFYKVTLVKVCILVQKVVTLASGKRMPSR